MPQLEFWHFLPQFFWLTVCFTALYLVMAFIALPRIGRVLAERRNRIAADLDAAEKIRGEADAAMAAYDASLVEAREKARAAIAEAVRTSTGAAEARGHELDDEIAGLTEEARRSIAAARSETMDHLSDLAADAARAAAARLAGIEVTADQAARAVAAAREN